MLGRAQSARNSSTANCIESRSNVLAGDENERTPCLRLSQPPQVYDLKQVGPGGLIRYLVRRLVAVDPMDRTRVLQCVVQERDLAMVEP